MHGCLPLLTSLVMLQGCEARCQQTSNNATSDEINRGVCEGILARRVADIEKVPSIYIPVDQEIVEFAPVACHGNVRLTARRDSSADFAKLMRLYLDRFDRKTREPTSIVVAAISGRIQYDDGTMSISVNQISNEKVQPRGSNQ